MTSRSSEARFLAASAFFLKRTALSAWRWSFLGFGFLAALSASSEIAWASASTEASLSSSSSKIYIPPSAWMMLLRDASEIEWAAGLKTSVVLID